VRCAGWHDHALSPRLILRPMHTVAPRARARRPAFGALGNASVARACRNGELRSPQRHAGVNRPYFGHTERSPVLAGIWRRAVIANSFPGRYSSQRAMTSRRAGKALREITNGGGMGFFSSLFGGGGGDGGGNKRRSWSPRDNHGPVVRSGPTYGKNRSRNNDGQWRKKRSDAK